MKQDGFSKQRTALLAGPVVWAVYFTILYLLNEAACGLGRWQGALIPVALGLMLPVLAVVIYAGWLGWQLRAEPVAPPEGLSEIDPGQMRRFSGQVAVMLNLLFIVLTLAVAVTSLTLRPC